MDHEKDPQIVTTSKYRKGRDQDYLVFKFNLVLLELTVVAKIPLEGEKRAPVYINFKLAPRGTSVVQTPDGAYPAPETSEPEMAGTG